MLTPKGCHVRYVALDGAGKAEVRVSCIPTSGSPYGENVNHSVNVKASTLRFRGAYVTGKARVDFVLSPAHATCKKSGAEIACKLTGETSSESLRGPGAVWKAPKQKKLKPAKREVGWKQRLREKYPESEAFKRYAGRR
jgi:hypothetical protein